MSKILILGGTREAAKLAQELHDAGHDVTTSLAGRTKEPEPLAGNTRIGGFGGVEGLATYLRGNRFDKLIDATHPFAQQISINAKQAAELANIPIETKTRPPWQKHPNDNWIEVATLEQARDVVPANARVLLALGSQHIDLFKSRDDIWFLVRMVDEPKTALTLPHHEVLQGKPSNNPLDEEAILERFQITHVVCRNSGGKGAYAKIEAARELGLPVVILKPYP